MVYDGVDVIRQGYLPWGERNFIDGAAELPTTFRYTGQREAAEIGLYYYGARWFDPSISRWIQPDILIPDPAITLDWDRYSYVRNNPIRYTDSSGHCIDGISCTELIPVVVVAVAVAATALVVHHHMVESGGYEAFIEGTQIVYNAVTDDVSEITNDAVESLRSLSGREEPKPLMPGEQKYIDKLNEIDVFLEKHKELPWEAKYGVKIKGKDHFEYEIPEIIQGLENSIEYLESIYDKRTPEVQEEIDRAIEKGKEALEYLKELQEEAKGNED